MPIGYVGSKLYKLTKAVEEKGGGSISTKAWTKKQKKQIEKYEEKKDLKEKLKIKPKTTADFQGEALKWGMEKGLEYLPYAFNLGTLATKGVADVVGDIQKGKTPIIHDVPIPVQKPTGDLHDYTSGAQSLPVLVKEVDSPVTDAASNILGIKQKSGFNLGTLDKILLAAGLLGGLWFISKIMKK